MSESAPATAMTDRDEGGRYLVDGGRLAHRKVTRDGTFVESLCNFDAQVIEELALDDGAEAARAFVLTGRLWTGEPLPAVRVPAGKFAGLEWLAEAWGHRPIVRAGAGVRDQLREAMLSLSLGARTRTLYTHTGWRQHGGRWVFLHGGGALGAASVDAEGVEVELGRDLGRYALPAEPENVREAMQGSLALLRVAPLRVTVPLWAAMYRAPLAAAVPTDQALWLEGVTGSLKSTLAALFLAHFGPFDRLTLPANWSSTANGLERAAFLAKDVPLVIDDWAPGGLDARELELKAARLLRAQGNAAGRGRLRADLTERPSFYPRGLLVATGEQHPVGASVLARLVLVECARDLVALDRLSAAQARADRLPHAMAGYLRWLAPTMPHLVPVLRAGIAAVRGRAGPTVRTCASPRPWPISGSDSIAALPSPRRSGRALPGRLTRSAPTGGRPSPRRGRPSPPSSRANGPPIASSAWCWPSSARRKPRSAPRMRRRTCATSSAGSTTTTCISIPSPPSAPSAASAGTAAIPTRSATPASARISPAKACSMAMKDGPPPASGSAAEPGACSDSAGMPSSSSPAPSLPPKNQSPAHDGPAPADTAAATAATGATACERRDSPPGDPSAPACNRRSRNRRCNRCPREREALA
jgi:hypothetical protein